MNTRISCWLLVAAAAAACSESPTGPSTFHTMALAVGSTTDAFEYRHAPGDTIDVAWQERYHAWAIAALQISPPRRIRYNKYQSRDHMNALIGVGNTNGFANGETFEIHTLWSRDNHEVVHLYSSAFGHPGAIWNEGLAVAFQVDPVAGNFVPRWSGTAIDDLARQFRASGRLVPIAELLTTSEFRRFDPNVTYPQAGSFMRHVLATCGLDGVKRLFRTGASADTADTVAANFIATCGRSMQQAELDWLAALDAR